MSALRRSLALDVAWLPASMLLSWLLLLGDRPMRGRCATGGQGCRQRVLGCLVAEFCSMSGSRAEALRAVAAKVPTTCFRTFPAGAL